MEFGVVVFAGVSNESRKVFGLTPHPGRTANCVSGNADSLEIFESILKTVHA